MSPTITHLCPLFMMNHILWSHPQTCSQSGKQLTFPSTVKEGYIKNFWKVKRWPGRTHQVMSAAVSMAANWHSIGSLALMQGLGYCLSRRILIDVAVQRLWNTTRITLSTPLTPLLLSLSHLTVFVCVANSLFLYFLLLKLKTVSPQLSLLAE